MCVRESERESVCVCEREQRQTKTVLYLVAAHLSFVYFVFFGVCVCGVFHRRDDGKPPYSYATLITFAINR